jgi:hypothetical protein
MQPLPLLKGSLRINWAGPGSHYTKVFVSLENWCPERNDLNFSQAEINMRVTLMTLAVLLRALHVLQLDEAGT